MKRTSEPAAGCRTFRPLRRSAWAAVALLLLVSRGPGQTTAPSSRPAGEAEVVVFLGDELMDSPDPRNSAHFPLLIETFLTVQSGDRGTRFVNVGWAGDTAARALLRLDRDVLSRRPTRVVICLGLNDPEYAPFSADRLAKFKRDLAALVTRVQAAPARVWLISPPAVREDLGRAARIQRDGQASLVNLEAIAYNATLAQYAAAVGEVAHATGSGFTDAYAETLNLRPAAGAGSAAGWRDGRLPPTQAHAKIAAAVLRDWGIKPIQANLTMDWTQGTLTLASPGAPPRTAPVETTEDGRRIVALDDLPMPWPVPGGRANGLHPEWEAADWCRIVLQVTNPPARGLVLAQEGPDAGGTTTATAAQLQAGFNLATAEPLRGTRAVQELLTYVGLKNYYRYSSWRRQELAPPQEPELAAAQRQLISAMEGYVAGYEQIIRKRPKTLNLRLVLSESVPPERVPTAPPVTTRPRPGPASRPATQPSTAPASASASRPASAPASSPASRPASRPAS